MWAGHGVQSLMGHAPEQGAARRASVPVLGLVVIGIVAVVLVVIALVWAAKPPSGGESGPVHAPLAQRTQIASLRGLGHAPEHLPRLPSIVGRVQYSAGEALGGALVCASLEAATAPMGDRRRVPTNAGFMGIVCERTGPEGRFQLHPGRGRFTLRAGSPGYRSGPEEPLVVALAPGVPTVPVEIILEKGGISVRGHVVDRFGGPVEGAIVTSDRGSFAISGQDGMFALSVDDSRAVIIAWHPGYVTQGVPTRAPVSDLMLTLIPESVIEGSVIDREGQAIAGIEVRTGRHDRGEVTTSDERGNFRLAGLRPGVLALRAVDDAFDGVSSPLQLGIGESLQEIVIRAEPSMWPLWTLVDGATGEPCVGASVRIRSERSSSLPVFEAGESASMVLVDVLPDLYQVTLRCPGYVTLRKEVLVEAKERRQFALAAGFRVTGIVRDAQGKPAVKARVYTKENAREASSTDRRGHFAIGGLAPGPLTIIAKGAHTLGAAPATLNLDLSGDRDGIELTYPATGELRGRLLTDEGSAAVGAQVVLREIDSFASVRLVSDESGAFYAFPAPGLYSISASWGRQQVDVDDDAGRTIEVLEDGPTLLTLRLPKRPDYEIAGRVVDQQGDPVADVAVRTGSGIEALSDAEGRFSLRHLRDPEVSLSLSADDGARALYRDLDIRNADDLELVLATTAEVCGDVEGLDPGASYVVEGFRCSGESASFCVPGVPWGRQVLVAQQGDRSGSVSVEVRDPTPRIKIELAAPGGPVSGRIVDSKGQPTVGAIWLLGPDGKFIRSTDTNSEGMFRFASVPAGAISLRFRRPGQVRGRAHWPGRDLDVRPGQSVDSLEIVVERMRTD